MASTYSTNLALELIGTGDQSGTWGDTTNTNLGTLIEQAISGYVTQAITDGADTTITIPNGATGVARNMAIEMTGALTAARNLIVPANKKLYFIYNNTTGGFAVTVKVSGQTGVSVPNGKKMLLVSNGTDIVEAVNAHSTLAVAGVSSFADGTVGTPGINFSSDTDSGIYRIGANNIGIGVNGAKVLDIGTTGLGVTGNITNANQVITASNSSTGLEINHSGSAQQGLNVNMTHASYTGTAVYVNTTRAANAAFDLLNLQTNGTARFRVDGLGTTRMGPASAALSALIVGASANYAMQVSSDGSSSSQCAIFILNPTSTSSAVDIWNKNTSGDNIFQYFFTESSATLRGSITYNRGGGVVAYNTTSDYRAKTIYGPLADTGATIDALKVYRGKMNGATIERPMLIAHEAQEVVPYAVNGEKDELDEKGQPKYQTMDHQILVPLLIAEIQSLRARVAALESKP